MVHQHLVHLLELLQRVLVVLTGALRQDVHLEVRVGDLLLVRLLVRGGVLLTLALERLICGLKGLLLGVEAVLDDGRACKQAFFQAAQGFVLDLDCSLLLQRDARVVVTALFEDRHEDIVGLLLILLVLVILLALLHLLASLGIDGHLEDAREDVLLVLGRALLVDGLLALLSLSHLSVHLLLLRVDLLVAVHLKLVVLLLDLLILGLLLVLVVDVVDVGVAD